VCGIVNLRETYRFYRVAAGVVIWFATMNAKPVNLTTFWSPATLSSERGIGIPEILQL
jgi:hypothetical protein